MKTTVYKSVGSSVETQAAQRADGAWFKRMRYQDPRYGWKWSRWERMQAAPVMWSEANGWDSFGYLPAQYTGNVRLPKADQ